MERDDTCGVVAICGLGTVEGMLRKFGVLRHVWAAMIRHRPSWEEGEEKEHSPDSVQLKYFDVLAAFAATAQVIIFIWAHCLFQQWLYDVWDGADAKGMVNGKKAHSIIHHQDSARSSVI